MHKWKNARWKKRRDLGRNLVQLLKMHKCKSAKKRAGKKEGIWGETYSRL
jgi:hypothetical protein